MTDKEIFTAAGVSKAFFYNKAKKMPGFPHDGTDEQKISFCVIKKDNNKGRRPNRVKKAIDPKTDEKAYSLALEREELDAAKVHDQIMKNQWKILATRDEKLTDLLNQFITGLLEDCKTCKMTKKQLNTLQDATSERLKILSEQLEALRQG